MNNGYIEPDVAINTILIGFVTSINMILAGFITSINTILAGFVTSSSLYAAYSRLSTAFRL